MTRPPPVKTPPADPDYVKPADDELNERNWDWDDWRWYLAVRDADQTNDPARLIVPRQRP